MKPKVCVIIPCRGAGDHLHACLDSLGAADYPDYEIIVVDDGIEPGRLAEIRGMKGITVLSSEGRGPSYARNLAAGKTEARYVVFTDSDCIVDAGWLSSLMEGFDVFPDAVGGGGRQELPQDAGDFQREVFSFMCATGLLTDYARRRESNAVGEVNHNASCNAVYKRDALLEEGGFLEGLWPGEDVELDYRLRRRGKKLFFQPASIVYHYKPDSPEKFRRMMFHYGRAQGALVRRQGGAFRRIHYIPVAVCVYLLFLIAHPPAALTGIVVAAAGARFYLGNMRQVRLTGEGLFFWNAGFFRGLFQRI
ncbi:MAG: glycosyltransferase [Candidatus Omnitrophica bacterium]|nr:glycosyltransferase [Candidatus Omnitrophota bacterium]